MASADIVTLPSHTEGFPNVILEAMACSKPIVATRVGAIAEMLDADSSAPCGVVIEPKDTPALTAALKNLMTDRSLGQKLGQRAREKVEREYGEPVVMNRLVALWRELGGLKGYAQADSGG
jgi:glycosyltransferase involved in cell wall biosynthesis